MFSANTSHLCFARLIGLRRRAISCFALLLAATMGCADLKHRRNPQPEVISNEDAAQIQPVVHSHSFTMRNADATRQLAAGVYGVENSDWRWTAGEFSVVLATPRGASTHGAGLVFEFFIPDGNLHRTGPVTLTAYLNEQEIGTTTYTAPGGHRFSAAISPELVKQSPVVIDFHLDRCVPRGVLDIRELGVVALTVSLSANEHS
jgi:hypothetical protein